MSRDTNCASWAWPSSSKAEASDGAHRSPLRAVSRRRPSSERRLASRPLPSPRPARNAARSQAEAPSWASRITSTSSWASSCPEVTDRRRHHLAGPARRGPRPAIRGVRQPARAWASPWVAAQPGCVVELVSGSTSPGLLATATVRLLRLPAGHRGRHAMGFPLPWNESQ